LSSSDFPALNAESISQPQPQTQVGEDSPAQDREALDKAERKAAKKAAAEKEAADLKRKADTDALHQAAVDALNLDLRRLRNQRSASGGLPKAPAASSRPDLAAFDRAELAGALRALDDDFQAIAGEGAAATIGLDSAKRWAQQR